MLSLAADTRIFVAARATDMRKGFDGLQGVITGVLEKIRFRAICFCSSTAAATS